MRFHSMGAAEARALELLFTSPFPLRVEALSQQGGFTPREAADVTVSMRKNGLVEVEQDSAPGSASTIRLTGKGRRKAGALSALGRPWPFI